MSEHQLIEKELDRCLDLFPHPQTELSERILRSRVIRLAARRLGTTSRRIARFVATDPERFRWLHPRGDRGRFLSKQSIQDGLRRQIDESLSGMDSEKATLFGNTIRQVLGELSAGLLRRVAVRVSRWHFVGTLDEMKQAHRRAGGNNPDNKTIGAFMVPDGTGRLEVYLNGGDSSRTRTMLETYRHEVAHVLDGVEEPYLSDDRQWRDAWRAEIDDFVRRPLSRYSLLNPREGFAEFGRLVFSDRQAAQRNFPLAWAFWKKKHLV